MGPRQCNSTPGCVLSPRPAAGGTPAWLRLSNTTYTFYSKLSSLCSPPCLKPGLLPQYLTFPLLLLPRGTHHRRRGGCHANASQVTKGLFKNILSVSEILSPHRYTSLENLPFTLGINEIKFCQRLHSIPLHISYRYLLTKPNNNIKQTPSLL